MIPYAAHMAPARSVLHFDLHLAYSASRHQPNTRRELMQQHACHCNAAGYLAPETISQGRLDKASDCFAFGMLSKRGQQP